MQGDVRRRLMQLDGPSGNIRRSLATAQPADVGRPAAPHTLALAGRSLLTRAAKGRVRVENARIYAGFHFGFSCVDGATLGTHVAHYVTGTLMQPLHRTR
jgi:hypothetical protein